MIHVPVEVGKNIKNAAVEVDDNIYPPVEYTEEMYVGDNDDDSILDRFMHS